MEANGKTAIITGTSGKLGRELAISLAKSGFCCLCHYHSNRSIAEEVAAEIAATGAIVRLVCCNLSQKEGVRQIFKAAVSMPQATVLVNSASVFYKTELQSEKIDSISGLFSLNATAPLALSIEFAKRFDGDLAKIINITDIAGQSAWVGYSGYCASKAALISITKSLAKELAPQILVNAISPGVINWPPDFDKQEAVRQIAKVPLGRAANYAELTSTLNFLIANDYITGEIINVDGGRSL